MFKKAPDMGMRTELIQMLIPLGFQAVNEALQIEAESLAGIKHSRDMRHHEGLGKSFKTTNVIESIQARIGQHTDKVDFWKNSDQKRRWIATSLLDIEPRPIKVSRIRYLPLLRTALKREPKLEPKQLLKTA